MHPSTSYEDFVEGLRYDQEAQGFRLRNGFMTRAVIEAARLTLPWITYFCWTR